MESHAPKPNACLLQHLVGLLKPPMPTFLPARLSEIARNKQWSSTTGVVVRSGQPQFYSSPRRASPGSSVLGMTVDDPQSYQPVWGGVASYISHALSLAPVVPR
jgi:hypothetical protein